MTTQFINPRHLFVSLVTISASSLIDPDALAHVASLFAPSIEDDAWLLVMPARSLERWYDWIV